MQKTLVKIRFGSYMFGTNVAESDTDFRSIHIPDAKDILLRRADPILDLGTKQDPTKPNSPEDVDHKSHSLQKYLEFLLEGNEDCLAMLFAPERCVIESSLEWEELRRRREEWLFRGIDGMKKFWSGKINKYCIFGGRIEIAETAMKFFAKMIESHGPQKKLDDVWGDIESMVKSQPSPFMRIVEGDQKMLEVCDKKTQSQANLKAAHATYRGLHEGYIKRAAQAEAGVGVDWKQLMHVARVCHEGQELLLDHRITYPRPEAELLLRIRKGELPYQQVTELIDACVQRVAECETRSTLQERPDRESAEQFVFEAYRAHVVSSK